MESGSGRSGGLAGTHRRGRKGTPPRESRTGETRNVVTGFPVTKGFPVCSKEVLKGQRTSPGGTRTDSGPGTVPKNRCRDLLTSLLSALFFTRLFGFTPRDSQTPLRYPWHRGDGTKIPVNGTVSVRP